MKSVIATLAFALALSSTPAFADEPPSDDKGNCSAGYYELGFGLVAAIVVMRRRGTSRAADGDTKRAP